MAAWLWRYYIEAQFRTLSAGGIHEVRERSDVLAIEHLASDGPLDEQSSETHDGETSQQKST
jgi:hypothetical protein